MESVPLLARSSGQKVMIQDLDDDRPVTTYEARSRGSVDYIGYLRGVWKRRQLLVHLGRTSNKAEYSDTALGRVWHFLDPLLLGGIYFLLVTVIRGGEGTGIRLLSFLLAGIYFYTFLRNCLQAASSSIVTGQRLVLNSTFPRALLPLSKVYAAASMFRFHVAVYVVFHIAMQRPVGIGAVFIPLVFLNLAAFAIGVSLLFSAMVVRYRDVLHVMRFALRMWLHLTPILFEASRIPSNVKPFLMANPLYPTFTALQEIILGGAPSVLQLLAGAGWSVLALLVGFAYFVRHERDFAVRL